MPTGTVSVDFGSLTAALGGAKSGPAMLASVTVSGQTTIASGTRVEAWIRAEPAGTADHSQGEHIALQEDLDIVACNIVAGTSFDIVVRHRRGGVYGLVSIDWAWV